MRVRNEFFVRRKYPGATSQYVGVMRVGNSWHSYSTRNGKIRWFGSYRTEVEAAQAHDNAMRQIDGLIALLNFPTLIERIERRRAWFFQYVRLTDYHEDDCWDWIGPLYKTWKRPEFWYGTVKEDGRQKLAHRVSYEIFKGEIPEGMMVCHKCDRPLCVNPNHLFIGTAKDNRRDCVSKNRHNPVSGERQGQAKLTREKVRQIRSRPGVTNRELAKEFGVSQSVISAIRLGNSWKEEALCR